MATPQPDWPQYHYRGTLVRAVDGDTAILDLDLGFDVHLRRSIRLTGYNAPELRGPDRARGAEARDHLAGLLEGRVLLVRTIKGRQTFERYLAQVFVAEPPIDVADAMIAAGFDGPRGR